MKRKVLLIQQTIPSYRVPIFNLLCESVDLTIVYESGAEPAGAAFAVRRVETLRVPRVGKLYRGGLRRLTSGYDVVINSFDTPPYAVSALSRLKRRGFGLIHWGIGVSASYTAAYDEDRAFDAFYARVLGASDACLFYASYPVEKYAAQGWPREKLFVAPNTVRVIRDDTPRERDALLFLGSLYPQKGFDELFEQYALACEHEPNVPRLVIIGDGSERGRIEAWVREKGLSERVTLTGAIYDDAELGRWFAQAIACVSPKQAGLTVLKAMGCGVPYITRRDAITGGERFNIEPDVNGVLYDTPEELCACILDLARNRGTYLRCGENALAYYERCRKPSDMVQGFLDAIDYAYGQFQRRSGKA